MLAQGQGHVLGQGERAQQRAVLEQHAHLAAHAAEFRAVQGEKIPAAQIHAAGQRPRKADDMPQQGGFAAARAAQNDGNLARGQHGVDVAQHHVLAVAHAQVVKFNVPSLHTSAYNKNDVST